MNYNEVIAALQVLGAIPQNSEDANFQKLVPSMFHYADGRIYRELTFLHTDVTSEILLTAFAREIALPRNVLTVRSVAILTPRDPLNTPAELTPNKRRHHPERVSPEAIDMFWPQANFKPGVPRKYAIVGYQVPPEELPSPEPPDTQPRQPVYVPEKFILRLRLMPAPDRAYGAEIFGGVEPEILSERNPETLLSRYYSELLIAACMVYLTGYQRDYGAASDDPQRAVSWESQYQTLRDSIALELKRARGEGPGFTALPPAAGAQMPR